MRLFVHTKAVVMAEVTQAFDDFQAGKLGTIRAFHDHGDVDVTDR